jgi:hypothetical protein
MAVHAERLHTHDTGLVIALDEIADVLELRLLRIVVGIGRHVVKYEMTGKSLEKLRNVE